jgi:hypothetical protein
MGDYHDDEKLVAAKRDPSFREYVELLEARKGKARAQEILEVGRWNSNVYPNLSFMSQFRQIRVVQPVSLNRTEVYTYCFRLKGAPEKMFRDTIRFANVVNGTGSPVLTDDLETYGRIGGGMVSTGTDWIQIGRGYKTDRPDEHGGLMGKNATSEVFIRNMFETWADYMAPAARA